MLTYDLAMSWAFGLSVSIGDGFIVAGAPYEGAVGPLAGPGNSFVFNARTGSLLSTLANPDAQRAGLFGESVSVGGGMIVVGAPHILVSGYAAAGEAIVFNVIRADSRQYSRVPTRENMDFSVGQSMPINRS